MELIGITLIFYTGFYSGNAFAKSRKAFRWDFWITLAVLLFGGV